ncbi:MAG TPA: lipopolysaccharide biosynthesis protein [Beijerinckiaceae bacterium]|nr:lipopolysaccharide biosynthesis protein [Beijerinckiaceae bacterium]
MADDASKHEAPIDHHAAASRVRASLVALAKDGASATLIKLASAALSFVLFVAVAMVTDERQFGLYSAAYAGASLVSFFASVGQQGTVLRFWPQYAGNNDLSSAHGIMLRAITVALSGLILFSLLILVIGILPIASRDVPEWRALCTATALLAFALGWSEFTCGAFRAKGLLLFGLLPRDIAWRVISIIAFGAIYLLHSKIDAVTAVYVTAALLIVAVIPQTFLLLRDTWRAAPSPLTARQKADFQRVTLGIWGVTSIPPALAQVSTLLVAAILGPEMAGAVFVADRTTRLVVLALNGINQALAPQISGAFYTGDVPHVQRITNLAALGGFVIALFVLATFWIFGEAIFAIFNPAYATPTMHTTLVIFCLGATIGTACGPTEILLQMTGLQHALFKLLVAVNVVGLCVTAAATYALGPVGAAMGIAGTVIVWCLIAVSIAKRKIGVDPSILGLFGHKDGFSVRLFSNRLFPRART